MGDRLLFLFPLYFISSGMVEGGRGRHMMWTGRRRHTRLGACESGGLELVPFFSFLLYLFVMNDREIPRNKFDSTLEISFDSCKI
jgi:nitric oxide reductase large subunit